MLELKSVSWQNFMSYGDYENTLDIEGMGQCLITGRVSEEDHKVMAGDGNPLNIVKSNGAGKSTIPSVIQWVLFGRTMHSASPGDKVINWYTGKDCWGRVDFKNGDSITRTRGVNGHNELIFVKDGDQTKLVADTLSTTKSQQLRLSREFGLDWELFCGSVFFNQYGKPWMEMADQTRKKAIERALHVDRFAYYAKVAKAKCDSIDSDIESKRRKIDSLVEEINRARSQVERLIEASKNFSTGKQERVKAALMEAVEEKKKRDVIKRPNLDKLEGRWNAVRQIEERLEKMRRELSNVRRNIATLEGTEKSLRTQIDTWRKKSGKSCVACMQDVPETHVAAQIEPIQLELSDILNSRAELEKELDRQNGVIAHVEKVLEDKSPDMTMRAARDLHQSWDRHDKAIKRLKDSATKIGDENNPHNKTIEETKKSVVDKESKIEKLDEEIKRLTFLSRHYFYIYKAYNDRTKVKSYVFQEYVPFINSRLRHYLDVFGLDIHIELTPALGISSDKWGYDFESGGERKRTDVAFQLAMFDFHEQMYGRQCNVLVLDEVDGRLDDDGIDSLISIIKNDLAPKAETILIISHRNMMADVFENELLVRRTKRFSQLSYI